MLRVLLVAIYGMLRAGLLLRKGFSPLISHNLWKVYAVPKNLWTRSNANQEKRNGADGIFVFLLLSYL
jgi:hypothetical protein